ncbi:chromosome partitioning protein ParA [Aliivibrio sp. S4TY2]|uniref:AAA family ATPase n=1 Tax=unclassified Aliivibrio TaxID=2645654 RepID=UPI00237946E4|nr:MULTISPECIES: chromosome partitioning protein ParA [unclassified Aliivibrio]MDD9157942.1 chromosome partitioning protein ParA [Aliivibrio sp. S4TY2]MDD9162237.1 chromosome partitioning protein ParA [Aliivibrio sp. S4TY1]MDD9166275.1 chromosome partitioning protein ParA [Aliivibrio sp. S4MY2]MDD9170252.1 chromosome partitioning protein ParA [Aliivibrio sp. S4MY4]MDD9187303.1 chromosome partitioning protein ParA [Aliivibrio sp. S4MY3]
MFDLVERLNVKNEDSNQSKENLNTVLFYQTDECRSLINESFRFDGNSEPKNSKNSDDEIRQVDLINPPNIVILELNTSANVVQDAQRISHLLPSNVSVVVIGSEDAISTIRLLKEMGFYYLFWPVSKQECSDFMRHVASNHEEHKGVGENRKAKRVAMVGVKGGMGTSLLSSEVARSLSLDRGVSTLLVDHNYHGGNLDIFMGLKQFQKRSLQKGTLFSDIDSAYASGLVKKITPTLSVLAIESEAISTQELTEYTQAIQKQVLSYSSVMVEDHAQLIRNTTDMNKLIENIDVIVFVLDSSVSALREYNRLYQLATTHNVEKKVRVITVMNSIRPNNPAAVSFEETEKYTGHRPHVFVPFDNKAAKYVLEGLQILKTKSVMARPISNLVSLILGEEVKQEQNSLFRFFSKG